MIKISPIGRVLKNARQNSGFTQNQLAKMIRKSKSTISLWENGKRSISAADFFKVLRVCEYQNKEIRTFFVLIGGKN